MQENLNPTRFPPQPAPSRNNTAADVEQVHSRVQSSIKKNGQTQLFYKAFLRPLEIALKTYSTQKDLEIIGCMPYGIKQVCKASIEDNKYILQDFYGLDQAMQKYASMSHPLSQQMPPTKQVLGGIASKNYPISLVKQLNCDNLISLLKPSIPQSSTSHPISSSALSSIKIAICVCMYSEDKSMLKRTLSGISQNIQTFHRNGISSQEIGVFVIMDGIEVVDQSIEQYFQELEKDNCIYLSEDVEATDPRDLINGDQMMSEVEDEDVENFNHLIFSQGEFQDRKKRRFCARRKEYKMYKNMIKDIEKLEKDKTLTFAGLDLLLQRFFIQKARQQYKKDYAASDMESKNVSQQQLIKIYAENIRISRPIILQALNQAKKYCNEYISTRDDLALLNCFRISIATPSQSRNSKSASYSPLNEQQPQSLNSSTPTPKMNLFMVTKYKNRGKLSSHNWFFNGFCQQLKPTYAILLDVGLTPEKDALYKMCSYMERKEKVGGVCGYMGLRIQKLGDDEEVKDDMIDCCTGVMLRLADIQRAQQFQYHFAHLIDKPFESSCSFIHVLPGAFSAYRMSALRPIGSADSEILKEYFKSIDTNVVSMSYKAYPFSICQTISKVILPEWMYYSSCCYGKPPADSYEKLLYDQNVYLAEDRTLCMGIHQNGYDLAYLPDANAWVDPIKTLYGMLGQRKRWINGSFFAFQKVKQTLQGSSNSDVLLKLQIFYLTLMNMLAYIAPALFMYTVHIAMYTFQSNVIISVLQQLSIIQDNAQARKNKLVGLFVYLVDLIYVLIFLSLVFYSMHLTNREPKFRSFFYGVSTLYGVFSISVFGVLVYDIISGFATAKNAFLINNQWFVDQIPGGQATINSLRYIMLGIMSLYAFPILAFLPFCKFQYIVDILFSTFSFIFYSPTYLNILNIYALCRIDDISWGTKGIDSGSNTKNNQMLDEWKKIKIIHVSKFVLYNLIAGFLLLLFGDDYVRRFWFTFAIMILLGVLLAIKVIIGVLYMIWYRCCGGVKLGGESVVGGDRIQEHFKKVKNSMYENIKNSIIGISEEMHKMNKQFTLKEVAHSSKIYKTFKFGKDPLQQSQQSNFLKFSKKAQNFSNIQKNKIESNILKQQLKKVSSPSKKQSLSLDQITVDMGRASDKDSTHNLKIGKFQQVVIDPSQQVSVNKDKNKKKTGIL